MRQLLLSDLWPTVSKLSKSAATVHAAIVYVSSAENLHLRDEDTLIVDASDAAYEPDRRRRRPYWNTSAAVLQFTTALGCTRNS